MRFYHQGAVTFFTRLFNFWTVENMVAHVETRISNA